MKAFIDFEATQFTQEIITIGCVLETGEEFYALINTNHEIGGFVSKLIGLKKEDFVNASSPDDVFGDFFKWLESHCEKKKIDFICYGNADAVFALNSLKKLRHSFYAQAILSLIITSTIDYSDYVKAKFGLNKHISLLKVAQYYSQDNELKQTHNALDDAKMLKFVYEKVQNGEPLVGNPFAEYMQRIEQYDLNGNLINTFFGLAQVADYIIKLKGMPKGTDKKKVKNKIINASEQKKTYCDFNWVILN